MKNAVEDAQAPWKLVNVASRAGLLAEVRDSLAAKQGFSIATLNLDHVVKLRLDPEFRSAYAAHSHVTADGNPIVWFSRLAGRRVELITGSGLVEPLMALCAELRVPIAMVGSTQSVLDLAAARLQARYRGLEIALVSAPPMGFDPDGDTARTTIDAISSSGAQLCLVALGAPKQERFSARAARHLPATGFVSVGAGLDFVADEQTRAPRVIQRLALEWLWRLAHDPRRLASRYAACASVIPTLAVRAFAERVDSCKAGSVG